MSSRSFYEATGRWIAGAAAGACVGPWCGVPPAEADARLRCFLDAVVDGADGALLASPHTPAMRGFRAGDHLRTAAARQLCARIRAAYAGAGAAAAGDLREFFNLVLKPDVHVPRLGTDTAGAALAWFVPAAVGDPAAYVSVRGLGLGLGLDRAPTPLVVVDAGAALAVGAVTAVGAARTVRAAGIGDPDFDALLAVRDLYPADSPQYNRACVDWLRKFEQRAAKGAGRAAKGATGAAAGRAWSPLIGTVHTL